ncbi:MAG: histidinol-phosphatase [Marinifilaceae bacterium]
MRSFSYHTHSSYCDGKGEPREFVERAIDLNMESIGFSAHTPLPFENVWSMEAERYEEYCGEIRRLTQEYKGQIEVYLSLELDYIPNRSFDFLEMNRKGNLDYTIGSVHLVAREGRKDLWFLDGPDTNYSKGLTEIFDGDIQLAVGAYFQQVNEMLRMHRPDIVGHIDKVKMNNKGRYFSEKEEWYLKLVQETLDVVRECGTIVEVNTRGIYKGKSKDLFPGDFVLAECLQRNIPVTISTDAHHPDELLGYFEEARQQLKGLGFREIMRFRNGKWENQSL